MNGEQCQALPNLNQLRHAHLSAAIIYTHRHHLVLVTLKANAHTTIPHSTDVKRLGGPKRCSTGVQWPVPKSLYSSGLAE